MAEDPMAFRRRRTGLVAIVAVPLFWFFLYVFGMANQASFFAIGEYLQQPMWTEFVPQPVGALQVATSVVLAFANLAMAVVAVAGAILLFTRFRPATLFKIVLWIFGTIVADMAAYEVLATLGYYLARHRLPSGFGQTLPACSFSIAILAALSALFWFSGRHLSRSVDAAAA